MFSCVPIRMMWLGLLGIAVAASPAAGAVEYTAADLGTLMSEFLSSLTFAYDINNAGVVGGIRCESASDVPGIRADSWGHRSATGLGKPLARGSSLRGVDGSNLHPGRRVNAPGTVR